MVLHIFVFGTSWSQSGSFRLVLAVLRHLRYSKTQIFKKPQIMGGRFTFLTRRVNCRHRMLCAMHIWFLLNFTQILTPNNISLRKIEYCNQTDMSESWAKNFVSNYRYCAANQSCSTTPCRNVCKIPVGNKCRVFGHTEHLSHVKIELSPYTSILSSSSYPRSQILRWPAVKKIYSVSVDTTRLMSLTSATLLGEDGKTSQLSRNWHWRLWFLFVSTKVKGRSETEPWDSEYDIIYWGAPK